MWMTPSSIMTANAAAAQMASPRAKLQRDFDLTDNPP
jgi:hypothetical protein